MKIFSVGINPITVHKFYIFYVLEAGFNKVIYCGVTLARRIHSNYSYYNTRIYHHPQEYANINSIIGIRAHHEYIR